MTSLVMFVIVKHLHRQIIRQPQLLTLTIHNYRHIHKTDTIARKKEEEEKKRKQQGGKTTKKQNDGVVGGLWMGGVASLSTLVT